MKQLFQIKICGITRPLDARVVCQAGADAIGLNFYAASSRFVERKIAIEIARTIEQFDLDGRRVSKVGVFVNSPVSEVVAIAQECGLDFVQFHGDEAADVVAEFRSAWDSRQRSTEVPPQVIRAVRTKPAARAGEGGSVGGDRELSENSAVEKVNREIAAWVEAGVDVILLDAAAPGLYGGTGKAVDWSVVPTLDCEVPLILAGGLTAKNVSEAIKVSCVSIVDTASGVESSPGIKEPELVAAFVGAAQEALPREHN
jgi:phosphoribosylanthranilate isomerase